MSFTWIAGYPKSGTTWLRCLLAAYINGRLELNTLSPFHHDDLNRWIWQLVACKPLDQLTASEAVILRGSVLHTLLSGNWGKLTCKTHSAIGTVDEFPLIPPSLTDKAICVVRDPRDIACSKAHHLGKTIDEVIELMENPHTIHSKGPGLFNVMGSWSQHVMGWATCNKFPVLVIKYEDMLLGPATVLQQAANFLELEIVPERLKLAADLCDFERLQSEEKEKGFKESYEGRQFFRKGKAGSWYEELSAEQVGRIEATHREAMGHFGYRLESALAA